MGSRANRGAAGKRRSSATRSRPVVFGAVVIMLPAAGALTVIWLIGFYAVIFGVMVLMLGLRLRTLARQG